MADKFAATFGRTLADLREAIAREREINEVREINAHLPFAHPIALTPEDE